MAKKHVVTKVETSKVGPVTIPEGTDLRSLITSLEYRLREEENEIEVSRTINTFPLDGARALRDVLETEFGVATVVQPKFGNIMAMEIAVSATKTEAVTWGKFRIPSVPEAVFSTGIDFNGPVPKFKVSGTCKKKYSSIFHMICDKVQEKLRKDSIYRSKAMFLNTDSDGDIDYSNLREVMTFIDTDKVQESDLIFPDKLRNQIEAQMFSPIKYSDQCRKAKIPLKRGVLLSGTYGCGKTLTAYVSAKLSEQNGWTFIYVKDARALAQAYKVAAQYQPAVLFAEDIDRVFSGTDRTPAIDNLLNTIDGVDNKNAEVMVILTTNDISKINQAMLRPGRLDSVIQVTPPDALAAQKLVRKYAAEYLSPDVDLTEVGNQLAGRIPAIIRECCERAKLSRISRQSDFITDVDLLEAAESINAHIQLLEPPQEVTTTAEMLADSLRAVVTNNQVVGRVRRAVRN